jgi:hypothetical protein
MKQKVTLLIVIFALLLSSVHCQLPYPFCFNDLVNKTAEIHKKNSCLGSDQLLHIDAFSYRDTVLYQLVFHPSAPCPDFIRNTIYYDDHCKIKVEIKDGGLKYRHQVTPSYIDTKQLLFIKSIKWQSDSSTNFAVKDYNKTIVTDKGKILQQFYLGCNVEMLWIAGSHVNWETGVADKPDAVAGNHTHCSAFVAAVCKRVGIYLLCPPQHGQLLLANAQYDWLQTDDAKKNGWKEIQSANRLTLYKLVQQLANNGNFIVAICKNPDATQPGHAALVMPKDISADKINESGPVLIMAGKHNFNYIALKNGFKSHIDTWPESEIKFYINDHQLTFDKVTTTGN